MMEGYGRDGVVGVVGQLGMGRPSVNMDHGIWEWMDYWIQRERPVGWLAMMLAQVEPE